MYLDRLSLFNFITLWQATNFETAHTYQKSTYDLTISMQMGSEITAAD